MSSRPSKGWKKSAPRLLSARRALIANCGAKCFLDPRRLKYPICDKSMDCKIQCAGLLAAAVRSAQFKNRRVQKKARKMRSRRCEKKQSVRRSPSPKRRSRSPVRRSPIRRSPVRRVSRKAGKKSVRRSKRSYL